MIYIINKKDEIIGFLKNNNAMSTPYYNDVHTNKIAENDEQIFSETLEFEVPYGYTTTELLDEGIQLLKADLTGKWKLFTIYQIDDSVDGITHTKKVYAINSLIWDLNHSYIEDRTWTAANSKSVFSYIFERTSWTLDNFNDAYLGGMRTFTISNGKRQQALDLAIKEFKIEIVAYANVVNGNVLDKRVSLVEKVGQKTGQRFEYRHNLKGATRTKSNDEFYTKLYVFGGTDDKGVKTTITSANKVRVKGTSGANIKYEYLPFLLDESANDLYNEGRKYLEGYIVNEDILKPEGLLDWGKKQFEYYNHPHYNYSIDVALLDERPNLGDTIAVVDFEMQPAMTISARVLETNYSDADPSTDFVVLGEFITIKATTPLEILNLQFLAQQALNQANKGEWRVEVLTPDGLDFEEETATKRLIARVYRGAEDVTAKMEKSAFIWQKINEEKEIDEAWTLAHRNVGNYIEIGIDESLHTIRCNIDDKISEDTMLMAKEKDFKFLSRIKLSDTYKEINAGVQQYVHYDYPRKQMFWTKVTKNTALVSEEDQKKKESFVVIRTDVEGNVLDFMTVKWGGHGSHFGFEFKDGKPYFLSPMTDTVNKATWVCEFPYQANKTITINSSSVTKVRKLDVRVNVDLRNNYVVTSAGANDKTKFNIYNREKFYKNPQIDALYTLTSADFGVQPHQVYQSCCFDFPYLYVSYGQTYAEGCKTYCVDVRTNSLVYRIDYEFDLGNMNFYHKHAELEGINYYYNEDGQKIMFQGIVFRNPIATIATRQNELYQFTEDARIDEFYVEDLTVDDTSLDEVIE